MNVFDTVAASLNRFQTNLVSIAATILMVASVASLFNGASQVAVIQGTAGLVCQLAVPYVAGDERSLTGSDAFRGAGLYVLDYGIVLLAVLGFTRLLAVGLANPLEAFGIVVASGYAIGLFVYTRRRFDRKTAE